MHQRKLLVRLGLLWPLCVVAPLAAQSNDEIQTGIQFNFSTPGARSLALGGAFLGLADDATAAYTNPAGLTQLAAPEFSLEGRAWTFTSLFASRGHTPQTGLTGIGIDTDDGLVDGTLEDKTAGVSFLSYVHPGDRWALALYRHELARFGGSIRTQGVFVGSRPNLARAFPACSHLDLEIRSFGLAGAWRVADQVSLGLGLSYYHLSLASLTAHYRRAARTGDPLVDMLTGNFYGPADFSPGNLASTQTQSGEDHDLAFHVGLLWRLGGRWSIGGVYRQGPAFDFRATYVHGPASDAPGEVDPTVGGDGSYHVPDVYGLGVAFRISDAMLLTLDYDRIEYSDMTDELVNLLLIARGEEESFVADDAGELHLGWEYQALRLRYPLAVRLGVWHDPDHRVRYQGEQNVLRARFRPGHDEIHVAGGLGLVVRRAQFDLAVDLSDRVETVSFSTVVRF